MNVLIDTSVWIEFFRPRPAIEEESLSLLSHLLEDDRAATIHPIRAELLSGRLDAGKARQIGDAFEAMTPIDPEWNEPGVWNRIVEMAEIARKGALPIPGIVDRMILVAVEKKESVLWTLDQPLLKLAAVIGIKLFRPG
jgi:predicted nucleic acid-binding protein